MITIEANALRAAFNFKAKNDVRKDLNNIIVKSGQLIGSNGHVAVIIPDESLDGMEGILDIDKAPPSTAVEVKFDDGTAISYDAKGNEKSRCGYRFIEQLIMFDFEELKPKKMFVEPEGFLLAPDYLALIGKSFPRPKKASKYAIRLVHSNPSNDSQVIVFNVVAPYLPSEIATVMIAPIKE